MATAELAPAALLELSSRLTEVPSSVDERTVTLVVDVVSTGRTIRAAMEGIGNTSALSTIRERAL